MVHLCIWSPFGGFCLTFRARASDFDTYPKHHTSGCRGLTCSVVCFFRQTCSRQDPTNVFSTRSCGCIKFQTGSIHCRHTTFGRATCKCSTLRSRRHCPLCLLHVLSFKVNMFKRIEDALPQSQQRSLLAPSLQQVDLSVDQLQHLHRSQQARERSTRRSQSIQPLSASASVLLSCWCTKASHCARD